MRRRWREITGRAMSDKRMDGETLSTLAMQNNVYRVMPHSHVARFFPGKIPVYNMVFYRSTLSFSIDKNLVDN